MSGEDDILMFVCAGVLILAAVIVLVTIILNLKAFDYRKRKDGQNTCLTVNAKKNLGKITVQARFGNEDIKFERKRVRKGQSIDFVYPASNKAAKLIVETESGSVQVVEV
jgi:hypothetical protein